MNFSNLIYTPGLIFAGFAGASLTGLILWWIVRKRETRLWLPTVRIIIDESRVLPRLVMRMPPLLGFLSFVALAITITMISARPKSQVFRPYEPDQSKILLFVDLSPSVSAYQTIDELAQQVAELFESLKKSGRISLATSYSPEVFQPGSPEDARDTIKKFGFHRAGLKIGEALKLILASVGEVDRLFVVSDRDQHSWTGFNWRFLLDDMAISFVDVTEKGSKNKQNIYISDAKMVYSSTNNSMEWDVEIARSQSDSETEGKLVARFMGKEIATFPWKIGIGRKRQIIRVDWPLNAISELSGNEATDAPIVLNLVVENPAVNDVILSDSEFRTEVSGLRQDVLIIGETIGEQLLEDPLGPLITSLSTLGFNTHRLDFIRLPGPILVANSFTVVAGGAGHDGNSFCPTQPKPKSESLNSHSSNRKPKVWLTPLGLDSDFNSLCNCLTDLMGTRDTLTEARDYCQFVHTRKDWAGLLPSLGGKQIGGSLGDASMALAFHFKNLANIELMVFTAPLRPLKATGINFPTMPLLIRDLLTFQGVLDQKGINSPSHWPRIQDIVSEGWNSKGTSEVQDTLRLKATNVPLGESALMETDVADLPPIWHHQEISAKNQPVKKDFEDPLPWIRLAAFVALLFCGLEAFLGLGLSFFRLIIKSREVLVLAFCLLGFPDLGEARVEFGVVGNQDTNILLTSLAREVSARTSIELTAKPFIFNKISDLALYQPWLWFSDPNLVINAKGQLHNDLAVWLKRGGFLIIETAMSTSQLSQITVNMTSDLGGWLPLPPDHELMRSFYLLDALPECSGEIWRGFHYDGRLAILAIPYGFLSSLKDQPQTPKCSRAPDMERSVRIFINMIMVALATDYKKDQIHLPEILKRLR